MISCADIERRYGQRKPIAQRTPIYPSTPRTNSDSTECSPSPTQCSGRNSPLSATDTLTTPTATDGETATESDTLATEPEAESDTPTSKSGTFTPPKRTASVIERKKTTKGQGISQHDLLNKYFKRDTVLLHNVDLFRWEISFRGATEVVLSFDVILIAELLISCCSSSSRTRSY
jgi:phosphatidylethanolamine N-methyltransferase